MRWSARLPTVGVAACTVAFAVVLSGCGGSASPPTAAGDSSTAPLGAGSNGPIELAVTIENLQVSPTIGRVGVDIGDEVHLSVLSDEDDIIHVHGVERLFPVKAGETEELDFRLPPGVPRGVYTVETHASRLILLELRVR